MMKNVVFNMSGEAVQGVAGAEVLDLSALDGTNCYCSNESEVSISAAIDSLGGEKRINWIDTGDYHYLSAITTGKIDQDYILLVLDHHPDTQEPAFEGMLSCGGWVREAFRRQAGADAEHINRGRLKQVLLVGINPDLELEFIDMIMDDVLAIDEFEFKGLDAESIKISADTKDMLSLLSPGLPVYISLDLDVLSEKFARTNWDQGRMSPDEVKAIIKAVVGRREVLGVDVCGGITAAKGGTDADGQLNAALRADFQQFFENIMQ